MLTLKLYPAEFRILMGYLRQSTAGQQQVALASQPLTRLVLLQYEQSWKAHRVLAWQGRNPNREYKLSIPLTVAKALYDDMRSAYLTAYEQLLLNKLDQAIINYRNPFTQPHVIGDLVVTGQLQ